ncbi:MAG TPA: restriction endonuclease subunit S [Candidatus Saccharibacteria bacterium]|nr:restriction endonuclease subunit S [Candidatus Saccharibacteria bacterium]
MTQTVSLANAITLQRGFDLPTPQRQPGEYPVVTSTGMATTHNEFKVKGPGVVIGRSGSIGGGQYIADDFWPLNTTLWVKDFKGNNEKFIYYLLKSLDFSSFNAGAAVPTLNRNHLSALKVHIPNRGEQDKIVNILSTLDEKIELNRKMNDKLEQIGQALFKHYFITNPAAREWKKGKFSDIADVLTGKGSTKSQLSENGIVPLYGANGIMGTSEDYLYDESLVITGRVGTLGKVRAVSGPVWLSDNVLIMRPRGSVFGFMYHLAKSFDYVSMNRGSSQPLVTQTDLKNKPIVIPDTKTLDLFESQFSVLRARQEKNEKEIQTLTTLRDTLLPRLISGKVKV